MDTTLRLIVAAITCLWVCVITVSRCVSAKALIALAWIAPGPFAGGLFITVRAFVAGDFHVAAFACIALCF